MNTRAHDLVVILHGILGMLPGATAIGFYQLPAATYIWIKVSTDAAVHVLSHDLGLRAPEITATPGRWWLRALSAATGDAVHVEVAGPHHHGSPPRGDPEAPSP